MGKTNTSSPQKVNDNEVKKEAVRLAYNERRRQRRNPYWFSNVRLLGEAQSIKRRTIAELETKHAKKSSNPVKRTGLLIYTSSKSKQHRWDVCSHVGNSVEISSMLSCPFSSHATEPFQTQCEETNVESDGLSLIYSADTSANVLSDVETDLEKGNREIKINYFFHSHFTFF